MTIENIIAQLDRISADSSYEIDGNLISLTIEDFDGFDDDWSEIERDFVDENAVDKVLEWLEKNADLVEPDFYSQYHFGEIVVEVGYASYDI